MKQIQTHDKTVNERQPKKCGHMGRHAGHMRRHGGGKTGHMRRHGAHEKTQKYAAHGKTRREHEATRGGTSWTESVV